MTEQPAWQGVDLAKLFGGRSGVIATTVPGVVLVITDAITALPVAVVAALVATLVVAVVRAVRREPLRQAAMGLVGVAFAAGLAAITGDPKKFFLPGILLNAAYALLTAGSIAIRRPVLGYLAALLDRGYAHWRSDAGLRRAAMLATALWCAVFMLRALVQGYLYLNDHVGWLASARLAMGLPLWVGAVAGTLFLLEGTRSREALSPGLVDDGEPGLLEG
jgi:hypothetical protein